MAKKKNNLMSVFNKPNKLVIGLVVFSTLASVLIVEHSTFVAGVAIVQAIFIKLTVEFMLGRFKKKRTFAKRRLRTSYFNTRDVKIALASVDKKMNRILKKAAPLKGAGKNHRLRSASLLRKQGGRGSVKGGVRTKRIKLIIMDFED